MDDDAKLDMMSIRIFLPQAPIVRRIKKSDEAVRTKKAPRSTGYTGIDGKVECVLCHERVFTGHLERHFLEVHKTTVYYRTGTRGNSGSWSHVHQGGLPGIGKKSR